MWLHLPRLHKHPLFSQTSEYQQEKMRAFSQRCKRYDLQPELNNSMEAPDKYQERTSEAAISLTGPEQDGEDHWGLVTQE
jgi:hypothetical protein